VFLFCSRLRPAEGWEAELAGLEGELEASVLAPEQREKLVRMLQVHAKRLRASAEGNADGDDPGRG